MNLTAGYTGSIGESLMLKTIKYLVLYVSLSAMSNLAIAETNLLRMETDPDKLCSFATVQDLKGCSKGELIVVDLPEVTLTEDPERPFVFNSGVTLADIALKYACNLEEGIQAVDLYGEKKLICYYRGTPRTPTIYTPPKVNYKVEIVE